MITHGLRFMPARLCALLLVLFATAATDAAILNLTLADDRDGGDNTGAGIYNYLAPQDLGSVRAFVGWTGQPWPYDLRAAWEYSLAGIPQGSTINSAVFTPKRAVANGGRGESFVTFHGYRGNGAVELADVVSTNNPLQTWDMFNSTFATDVTAYVQSLVSDGAPYVGIMARGLNGQIAFQSKDSTEVTDPAAKLVVNYTAIPEPAAGMLAIVATASGLHRRPRWPARAQGLK